MKFFVTRTPKHRQFDYKPRYWDQEAEEREERLKRLESLKDGSVEGTKARISSGFKRGYRGNSTVRRRQVMRSNLILIGIVVLLLFFCYLFLTVYLPRIEGFLGSPNPLQ